MQKILITSLMMAGALFFANSALHESEIVIQNGSAKVVEAEPAGAEASVPLAEKVGALFMIGHWADTPAADTAKLIRSHHLGGIIIMSAPSETAQVKDWTDLWQAAASTSLLIGIDQEGGTVQRLRGSGFSSIAQPAITDATQAYASAAERGRELAALGINLNFAPVLDASVRPDSFLYQRVFRDPAQIAELGGAMIRGYAEAGVLAVPKHFPGHPDTTDDSHKTLPVLNMSTQEYTAHISPFTDTITAGNTKLLMTAHVLMPELDPIYPATLSPVILDDLRRRTGYQGGIITDDFAMQAITDQWTYEEAAVLALHAGLDILLLAAEPARASSSIAAVIDAVETGELSEERINEAYQRVQALRN